ncbi:MAG: DEAD/DEAH box helicase [Syntrophomonas sp.]
MGLNPIKTKEDIGQQYIKYLKSLFFLKDKDLMLQAERLLNIGEKFVKGPFIEITPPFIMGKSLGDLIKEGTLSGEFFKIREHFPLDRALYAHQQAAIEKVVKEERNIVVATGTGSGKTECFMLPIIDYLMKQQQEGDLDRGVRALFLYPMNALANDQLARLRKILADYPEITFGRFTGETEEREDRAIELFRKMNPDIKRLKNEIISREEMRRTPPHILLTNYAMLEYLLLRPADNVFFDGQYARQWKFIVMDEVHSYNGAKGTEIAMLLRRLKQRITGGENGQIRCIATSATLGSGKDVYAEVADFSQSIFDEKFDPSDIVEARRVVLPDLPDEIVHRDVYAYEKFDDLLKRGQNQMLYEELKHDGNVILLQQLLQKAPQRLSDIAQFIFKKDNISLVDKEEILVNLVNLCAAAKNAEDDLPLLPARYHVFVKSLEGAYITLYPHKRLYLDRHTSEELSNGLHVPVFELANCQRCGQEYIVGSTHNDILCHVQSHVDIEGINSDRIEYYMLSQDYKSQEFDEDEMVLDHKQSEIDPKVEEYILCCGCGHIEKAGAKKNAQCCPHPDDKYIKVWRIKTRQNKANSCFNCGAHSPDLIKRFLTADDPATEVLAKALYQSIPPQITVNQINENNTLTEDDCFCFNMEEEDETLVKSEVNETGRKLLIFSDNRQEAAFFATYLNLKYNQVLWRNTIIRVMDELNDYDDIRIESVAQRLLDYGNRSDFFPNTMDDPQKIRTVYSYLMKEFIAQERQIGLEGLGMLSFIPKKPSRWGDFPDQGALGVDKDGMWEIYCVLFDSLRTSGAVTFPNGVAPTDEFFAPRNRHVYFRIEAEKNFKQSTVLGWLPKEKSSNRRLDYLIKILVKNGMSEAEAKPKAYKILFGLMGQNAIIFFKKLSYLMETHIAQEGTMLQLDYAMWNVSHNPNNLYRCQVCGNITNHNVNGVCPTYRCKGELKKYNNELTRFTYYKELYEDMKSIPMVAREHTAQLTSERASKLQNQFEKGEVNILSCSTTFEMGVDVGQLEAVFMRNVPPETSNYVQRAGRAGRRTETTAFALTYAKRRSHDLTYFQAPQTIIAGNIKPPYIEMKNDKIIKRHLYSVVFAWFFKQHNEFFGKVDAFFAYTNQQHGALEILREDLTDRPEDLLIALKTVIPDELHQYFALEEWGWVDDLLDEKDGILIIAQSCLNDILDELTQLETKLRVARKPSDSILRIKNTYLSKSILDFLSSNNVLPKYGFPVDVVELAVLHHGEEAKSISLTRDLRMAISEFAPGSEIIANGKVWKPYAVNKSSSKGWPVSQYAICPNCKKIHRYEADLGVENDDRVKECCGEELKYYHYIKPVFGFSTSVDAPNDPGEKRIIRSYPTQVIFDAFVDEDSYVSDSFEGTAEVGAIEVKYTYSSRGRMVLINQGPNKTGFRLCKSCGYVTNDKDNTMEKHKTKTGNLCGSNYMYNVHFGHDFITDVLELRLPEYADDCIQNGFWLSLLYAILEGASISLGISRNEINGCLYFNDENDSHVPSIMLFDDVPGGAGHVKKVSQNIKDVLWAARYKLAGCECGEETSCYGCLRNYGNQLFHESLSRGLPLKYLNDILMISPGREDGYMLSVEPKEYKINDKFLEELLHKSEQKIG